MKRIECPPDFVSRASLLSLSQAARAWNVSRQKAKCWYIECGITPMKADLHRNGYHQGKKAQQQIDVCLNCTRAQCPGSCDKMKRRKY